MSNEILKRDQNFVTVLAGVTDDSDQDIVMLRVDPTSKRLLIAVSGGGGGGGGYQPTTSGTVNGTNLIFGFATAPNVIVVDRGIVMTRVSKDGQVNWTIVGTTVTMTVAPTADIFAIG